LYPNLFASSLSDLHSYNNSGNFIKLNCYSTFFDLISGKGNTPAVFKNYAKRISEKLYAASSKKAVYNSIKDICNDERLFVREILNRIKSSELISGGARAEFRLRLCDFYSMALALESFFSEEVVKDLTFVFESSKIVNLSCLYVEMLQKQISSNFLKLLLDIDNLTLSSVSIFEHLTTISAFESLLTTTLFSGVTYSFAGSLVWNRSTETVRSLELTKCMRELDRIVF
jgi:hypothetical protein